MLPVRIFAELQADPVLSNAGIVVINVRITRTGQAYRMSQ